MSSNVMQLVSKPHALRRSCQSCGGTLLAIELWHDCPKRRLVEVKEVLREARVMRRIETMKRVSRARVRARA